MRFVIFFLIPLKSFGFSWSDPWPYSNDQDRIEAEKTLYETLLEFPDSKTLLQKAKSRTGHFEDRDFLRNYVFPCQEPTLSKSQRGLTLGLVRYTQTYSRESQEVQQNGIYPKALDKYFLKLWAPRFHQETTKYFRPFYGYGYFYDVTPSQVVVEVVKDAPTICIRKGLSHKDALEVLVHELVHFSLKNPFEDQVDQKVKTLSDYAVGEMNRAGGESDAFLLQAKFAKWFSEKLKEKMSSRYDIFFDGDKNLKTKSKEIAEFLLDRYGYKAHQKENYKRTYHQAIQEYSRKKERATELYRSGSFGLWRRAIEDEIRAYDIEIEKIKVQLNSLE